MADKDIDIVRAYIAGKKSTEKTGVPEESMASIVNKNVIQGDGSTFNRKDKVNPLLTSSEKARTYNSSIIMAEAFNAVALKNRGDTNKPQTIVAEKAKLVEKSRMDNIKNSVSKAGGLLANIAMIIAGIGIGIGLLHTYFGTIGDAISKLIMPIGYFLRTSGIQAALKSPKLVSLLSKMKGLGITVGTKIGLFARMMPLIGAAISFGFAYHYFNEGRWARGTVELIAGIANLGGVAGLPIVLIMTGLGVMMDLTESKSTTTQVSTYSKFLKAVAPFSIKKIAAKIGQVAGKTLLKSLKWIPWIGGLISLGLSVKRFSDGDWIGGILELLSGVANIVGPFTLGIGSAIGLVLDGILIYRDITGASQKNTINVKEKAGSLLNKMTGWGKTLMKYAWYSPILSGALYLGRGVGKLFKGEYKEGLLDIARSFVGTIGGKGLVDALEQAAGWVDSPKQATNSIVQAKKADLLNTIGSVLDNMVKYIGGIFTDFSAWVSNLAFNTIDKAKNKGKSSGISGKASGEASAVSRSVSQIKQSPPNTDEQNKLIKDQTATLGNLVFQLVNIAQQQLTVAQRQLAKPTAVVAGGNQNNNNVNLDAAYSSTKQDSRGMYFTSPYSLNTPAYT